MILERSLATKKDLLKIIRPLSHRHKILKTIVHAYLRMEE